MGLRRSPSAFQAGSRDADMLIIDGGILPFLGDEMDLRTIAAGVMWGKEIKIIPR
jgi:hypothetical protein